MHSRLRESGWGVPIPTMGQTLGYSIYICTLWTVLFLEYQSVCLRPNWLPPPPLPPASVPPPLEPKGQHSLAGEGAGGSQFERLKIKRGTLSTLLAWLINIIIIRWQAKPQTTCEGAVHIFKRGYPIFPTNEFILNKTMWCWRQISKTYISPSVINNVSGYLFVLTDIPSKEELRGRDHGKRIKRSS